jgi:hypothetical protein
MAIYTQDLPNIFNMDKINTSFMIALRLIIKLYLQMSIVSFTFVYHSAEWF